MLITEIIKLIKNKLPPTIDDYDEWWNDEDNDDCELTFTFNHCNYSIEISNYKDSFGLNGEIVSIDFMGEDFEFPINYVNEFDLKTDEEVIEQINIFVDAVKNTEVYHLISLAKNICKAISEPSDSGGDENYIVPNLVKHYLEKYYD